MSAVAPTADDLVQGWNNNAGGVMSGEGRGQSGTMFDWEYLSSNPQIHIHYFTDSTDFDLQGHWKIEICCHGCGNALLVKFLTPDADLHLPLRYEFEKQHACCANRKFDVNCPNYRSTITVLDLKDRSSTDVGRPRSDESGDGHPQVPGKKVAAPRGLRIRKKGTQG